MATTAGPNNLRQRRGNNKKVKSKKKDATKTTPKTNNGSSISPAVDEDETLWDTFIGHPIVKISILVLLPYCIYHAYYYIVLQHPPSFLLPPSLLDDDRSLLRLGLLRPAVSLTDERQVLLVGTWGAGLTDTASALYTTLQLEVALDASDTYWHFARDGTVSRSLYGWLRYSTLLQRAGRLCTTSTSTQRRWFHPKHHRSTSGCSPHRPWDACWAQECIDYVEQEGGCGWVASESDADDEEYSRGCTTPFRTTLLQVRHPLATLAALRAEWCDDTDGMDTSFRTLLDHAGLVTYDTMTVNSCLELLGHYVLKYNQVMLDAMDQGAVSGFYRVENASACEVARLAGLGDDATTVYPPTGAKFQRVCGGDKDHKDTAIQIKVNKNETAVIWDDLKGSTEGSTLEMALLELAKRLGYQDE